MVKLKIKNKIVAILIICIPLIITYLYCNTTLFFTKNSSQTVQVFFGISQAISPNASSRWGNGSWSSQTVYIQKYGGINSIDFIIEKPFERSQGEFQIFHNYFTRDIDFWYDFDNVGTQKYNFTKVNEYESFK